MAVNDVKKMLDIFHKSKSQNAELRYFHLEEFQALSEMERAKVLSNVFIVKGPSMVVPGRYVQYNANCEQSILFTHDIDYNRGQKGVQGTTVADMPASVGPSAENFRSTNASSE